LSNDDLVFGSGTAILKGGICGRYARKSAQELLDEWFDPDLGIMPRFSQERAKAREEQKRVTDWFASTPVIAASIIAAVRLTREQAIAPFDIGRNGQHCAGKNDPRKDRAIGWRKDDNRIKL
jgi:hypothetical protein